jgi:hypothetical protein
MGSESMSMVSGGAVRRFSLFLVAIATSASVAVAQPNSDAERSRCEGAAKDWAPVRLPAAGVNVAIPCSDDELSAYKNSNEERRRAEGLAGCESAGRTYFVMYFVNTPAGFFDSLASRWKASPLQRFQIAGHRVFRGAAVEAGEIQGQQLIEIDATRSVLMFAKSGAPDDPDFAKLTSCFFDTLHVVKP